MTFRPWPRVWIAGLLMLFRPIAALGQFSPPPFNYAAYATGTGCGAINMSGGAYTDSFDSSKGSYKQTKQNTRGNVGVSGNINLSGSAVIEGSISALNSSVGKCLNGKPGITLSGSAHATEGYILLRATPLFPNPPPVTPGSKDLKFAKSASLAPGNYHDITVSGHATLTLSAGTYNINSLVLSGGSVLASSGTGRVVLNAAESKCSQTFDFSGGSISNGSGVPANFQLIYSGKQPSILSGGAMSYAVAYMPNAPVTISGGGDWYGALVVHTLVDSGSTAIHFDRSLSGSSPPILASVNPNSGQEGQQNLSVALAGQFTHWVQGTTTASFGPGITVVSLTVNSATNATAVLNIDPAATTGSRAVTVTTSGEVVTLSGAFSVIAGTPVLLSVNPNKGQEGQQNLSVALTGQFTHWIQGTTTASFGAGISVASLTMNSATSATAVLNIAPAATPGTRAVTLTTGSEVVTFANGFAVTAGTPGLLTVSPNSGQQGQQILSVALTGQFTHWVQGTTTASFGAGITVASLTVNSATSATAALNIDAATAGPRTVSVATGAEVVTLTNGFAVTAGTPGLLTVSPNSGQQGQQILSVALTGQFTLWVQGTTTASFGPGITVVSLTVNSATSATAALNIDAAATAGPRTVSTTTGTEAVALTNGFAVTAGIPGLLTVSPNSGQQGQKNLSVALAGQFTHWVQGTTTVSFGAGITVASLTVNSTTSAMAVLNIDAAAVPGVRSIALTTGSEVTTLANGFTVTAGIPVLLSVNPKNGHEGQQNLSVVLIGQFTQWVQGTTSANFGAGITVASLTVNSATSATAVLKIDAAATPGARTLTLTTNAETDSLSNGFTVLGGQLTLSVQPPISPTFQSSQVIAGSFANEIGQTAVTITGGASGVEQHVPTSQTQFGLSVPLRPNAENLLTVTATDESGQTATASNLRIVQLTLANLVNAQVTAHRLSTSEVQALVANGTISLSNPSNFNVSMFALSLGIRGTDRQASLSVPLVAPVGQNFSLGPLITVDLKCQSPDTEIQQDGNTLLLPCSGGNGLWNIGQPQQLLLLPFEIDVPGAGGGSIPGVLVIEGKIKTLKEFFNVNLLLMNTSSDFTLTKVSAAVSIPDNGLSPVAPASGVITMNDLAPGSQGTGQFTIRGDVIGDHTVTVNFGAQVTSPLLTSPVPISGSASTSVTVEGPPTMNVTVEQPGSVTAGVPYTLKVNIKNTSSDLDALFASLELDLAGANIIDPATGLTAAGPSIVSLGDILAGKSVSESFTVVPQNTGPITSCVGGASQNITLSVVFTNSGQSCAIGTFPSQVVPPSGQPTVAVLPAPNTVGVPAGAVVTLLFSDAIQTGTVTAGIPGATFTLADSSGTLVPGTLQFSILPDGSSVATFKPAAALAYSSTYQIVVLPGIFDVNGMQLASGLTSIFTTEAPPPADTTPPQVTIQILPPANPVAVSQGALLQVLVNSSDNSGTVSRIDLQLDGQLVDARILQSAVTFLLDTSALDPGSSHVITAVATDPAGNTAHTSVNIAIASDTTPPTVSLIASTSVLRGQTLPVSIQASDDTRVARVDLLLDGGATPVYSGVLAPFETSLNTALLGSGLHQLLAVATDGAGNVAQANLVFSVTSVASIALSPGTITLNGTGGTQPLTVTATLTDGTTIPILSGVGFSSSNTTVAAVDSSGVVTSVTPGTATITATFGLLPPAHATVTDVASVPTTLALLSGNNQTGTAGQPLSAPLVVKVTDVNNRSVPNVAVTFSVSVGGGTVAQGTVATDSQGVSSTTLTLGQTPGANSATATAGTLAGSPVTFVATGTAGVAGLPPTATSELFNLNSLNWNSVGSMSAPRGGTTLTVLGDGTVLVLGGVNASTNVFPPLVSGELFSPSTRSWTSTVSLSAPRAFHTSTLLPNGTVLITGGLDANGNPVATAEIYRGPPIQQTTPVLTWATPASIAHATPLGSAQLNATANVPGSFTYTPPTGTVLAAGSQTLSVLFRPTDTIRYTTATARVTLTVTP